MNLCSNLLKRAPSNWEVRQINKADILNRSKLGAEVMHEKNAHNFPLDLAATGESLLVALTVPAKRFDIFNLSFSILFASK